jgi:hypothetical protein
MIKMETKESVKEQYEAHTKSWSNNNQNSRKDPAQKKVPEAGEKFSNSVAPPPSSGFVCFVYTPDKGLRPAAACFPANYQSPLKTEDSPRGS